MPFFAFRMSTSGRKDVFSHSKAQLCKQASAVSKEVKADVFVDEMMFEQLPFRQQVVAMMNQVDPLNVHPVGTWRNGKKLPVS